MVWSLPRVFTLFGYCITYGIPAHRHLAAIKVFFLGCEDIWQLEAAADRANRRWRQHPSPPAPLLHILGGSSYGGFTELHEPRVWIEALAQELRISVAMIALHLGNTGRVDFHIVAGNRTTEGLPLYKSDLLERARESARRLTAELNQRRLQRGELPIAELRADFTYHFPDPRIEAVSPEQALSGQLQPVQIACAPQTRVAGPATGRIHVPHPAAPHRKTGQSQSKPSHSQPAPRENKHSIEAEWERRIARLHNVAASECEERKRKKARQELEKMRATWLAEARALVASSEVKLAPEPRGAHATIVKTLAHEFLWTVRALERITAEKEQIALEKTKPLQEREL